MDLEGMQFRLDAVSVGWSISENSCQWDGIHFDLSLSFSHTLFLPLCLYPPPIAVGFNLYLKFKFGWMQFRFDDLSQRECMVAGSQYCYCHVKHQDKRKGNTIENLRFWLWHITRMLTTLFLEHVQNPPVSAVQYFLSRV